jgi:hypothetical protein
MDKKNKSSIIFVTQLFVIGNNCLVKVAALWVAILFLKS